ncbi:MAG: hypothetical protein A3K61_05100 [Thaumarchaeota archaeon RBG_16_49_8]|nr:MAG: hypothetical protein A3K61_05100 [Thaumarchaeota archaeon RBG_16_49_8]
MRSNHQPASSITKTSIGYRLTRNATGKPSKTSPSRSDLPTPDLLKLRCLPVKISSQELGTSSGTVRTVSPQTDSP